MKYQLIIFNILAKLIFYGESVCDSSVMDVNKNRILNTTSSRYYGTRHWNGTKPPFPRSTAPTTLINTIKFPLQLVELENGKRVIVHHRPHRLHRTQYCYPLNYNVSTLFEILDEVIYNALADPEIGFSFKIFRDINTFQFYLKKVKRMYIDKLDPPLDAVKFSIFRLYITKGGPSFTQFPLDDPSHKSKLIEIFNWNDETFERLRKQQKLIETTWNRIQTNLFNMNALSEFRGNSTVATYEFFSSQYYGETNQSTTEKLITIY